MLRSIFFLTTKLNHSQDLMFNYFPLDIKLISIKKPTKKMPSNTTKLWHNFLIYLPVFLILTMISTIYITYLFTYIAILLNAENQIPANFLLINTSSYNNSKTKGIILRIITLIFVLLLLVSIMKTVITDPGYFPEPSHLEYKMATSNSDRKSKENYRG